ncbi:hypothetical protein SUGI_1020820 [Cryptomeria japonica]|nr:hypothetical protein SUGI_1020820 [Cryptomeria japonica]
MHFQSVSAQQAYICTYPMRSCLGFRPAIARLFQPQAYCQAHHLIVRNLKTITEIDEQKKTEKKLRKPLTQKVLRQEASQKWLSSLSSVECDMTAGVKAEELATGLELCASADDLFQSEEVANGNGAANAWVLGIDPDNGGALAVLRTGDSAAQVYDAPTVQVCIGKRFRRRLDTRSIVSLLCGLGVPKGSSAYIEQAIPFPGDGKQGWWSNGFGYGLWIGILVSFGFSVIPIPSIVWKKHFDLVGKTTCKDDSRFIACNLFPYLSPQLKRKKDHGKLLLHLILFTCRL